MQQPIVLDHDIGTNPDDFFSLLLLLNSEGSNLRLVISGNNYPEQRAQLAQKVVTQAGRDDVRVLAGEQTGTIEFNAWELIEDTGPLPAASYKEELQALLQAHERVTYLCIQGLSNLAAFLKEYPAAAGQLDVIHMGLASNVGESFAGGGTNMEADALAAKFVYEFGLSSFRVVGPQTTINDRIRVHPETPLFQKIAASTHPNHLLLHRHLLEYHARRGIWPALHDPLATSVALSRDFVTFEPVSVEFDAEGRYRIGGVTKVLCSAEELQDPEGFMAWCTELV